MHRIFFLFCVIAVVSVGLSYVSLQSKQESFNTHENMAEFQFGTRSVSAIPNILWTFWHDDKAIPQVVQTCIQSWKHYNPGYDVRLVTKENLNQYLSKKEIDILNTYRFDKPAHFSDQVRIRLLDAYGGFWMDASLLCTHSLDWVHAIQQAKQCEVVGYYIGGMTTDPNYPVLENWFLACTPNASVIRAWKNEMIRMMTFPSTKAYLEDVTKIQHVNLQNIALRDYLSMHVAAQVVLQKHVKNPDELREKVFLLKAEDGPFKYLSMNNWDVEPAIQNLCTGKDSMALPPLIKFRGSEREYLEKNSDKNCVRSEGVIGPVM